MKKSVVITLLFISIMGVLSCYKDYYDITDTNLNSIKTVSFRNEVVPIVVSGGCGCHVNGTTRQVPFASGGSILYETILARSGMLASMANGGEHPGLGTIYFTPAQAQVIKTWIEQGAKDDYVPTTQTGNVTYATNIASIVKSTCDGSACHKGTAAELTYDVLKSESSAISAMMKSGGSSGHPGGNLSLSGTTTSLFMAWMEQGYKP